MNRSKVVALDSYGQDPLAVSLLDTLMSIKNTIPHKVGLDEEGNPQLIAYDRYGTVELYFLVLMFNGLGNSFDLVKGMELKLPEPNEVRAILNLKSKSKITLNNRVSI